MNLDQLLTTILVVCSVLLSSCNTEQPRRTIPEHASSNTKKQDSTTQWYCEGDHSKQWLCTDLSASGNKVRVPHKQANDAVEAEHTANAVPALSTAQAVNTVHAVSTVQVDNKIQAPQATAKPLTPAPDTIDHDRPTNNNPLNAYPSHYYVVQLIAAHNKKTIESFQRQHPQVSTQEINVILKDQAWRILILGAYPSTQEAKSAINAITPPLTSKPWIRSIKPLQQAGSF